MRNPPAPRRWLDHFTFKVFLCLAAPVVVVSLVSCLAYLHFQRTMLTQHIVGQGSLMARFLAHDVTLGVFAENEQEILSHLAAVLDREGVVEVRVFDRAGGLLARARGRPSQRGDLEEARWREAFRVARAAGRARHLEHPDSFTFWAPVRGGGPFEGEEELYFGAGVPSRGEAPIGFAAVRLSKEELHRGLAEILYRSTFTTFVFLVLGGLATYLVVRAANRPLRALVERVAPYATQAEGRDEIGLLDDSFNHLIQALDGAFDTINRLRLGLERAVEERTAELARANRELTAEIAERRRIEEALRRTHEELEERVRQRTAEIERMHRQLLHAEKLGAIGKLAASIAHEFNNPIFGVQNVLEALRARLPPSDRDAEMVDLALQECRRVTRLIRDLQGFNRPTSGTFGPTDVHQAIDAMLVFCKKDFSTRGIRVVKRYAQALPVVHAVEDQIRQVILNLFNNARDAMAEGGTLEVETEARNGAVAIRIRDSGRGIPPEDQQRVFEPFFTTKPSVKGTGLGLSVSYGIVKNHGGEIRVLSRPGAGTTFTVLLPVGGIPQ
ncbi:MAG: hypothetical protein Kow0092_39390 [Deferrisomatales bacterium]